MNPTPPAPSTPPPATPAPAINYLKLTLSLMAVVLFWSFIEHWDDVKTGFMAGWRGAPQQTSR